MSVALESVLPGLAARFETAAPPTQRKVALAVARLAVMRTGLADKRVTSLDVNDHGPVTQANETPCNYSLMSWTRQPGPHKRDSTPGPLPKTTTSATFARPELPRQCGSR